ncbi:hypothetical protein Poli38472_006436 [Pythium oligandrum]|uniref:Beta-adaptin appendage C-terminal subdomain domain-containing protein n=1 Tax=Pythium oligandrum TaxID=41045 RepID=A0A8K1C4S9_PYTOL|nr:hypothetical protein Poli38472_006436 [Pythium oligandrum]|eukprot:TMW56426.1 hypothetical protein Poli38472_006436 [Pythium oligandrum]
MLSDLLLDVTKDSVGVSHQYPGHVLGTISIVGNKAGTHAVTSSLDCQIRVLNLTDGSVEKTIDAGAGERECRQFPRQEAMPLEELSELTTGKNCGKSAVLAQILREIEKTVSVRGTFAAVDCVGTRMDEEMIGLFTVLQFCSPEANKDKGEMHVKEELEQLFEGPDRQKLYTSLIYRDVMANVDNVMISKSYELIKPEEDTPVFKFRAAQMWTEADQINVKLKVRNDGSSPLHVFAVTVKAFEDSSSLGVMLLPSESVAVLEPSQERTVAFQLKLAHAVDLPKDRHYGLYFAHSALRAHLLEGKLDGTKLKLVDKKKTQLKTVSDSISFKVDESASLEGSYSAFPFSMWRVMSIGVVLCVGLFATMFIRRKRIRFEWIRSMDCLKTRPLKYKTSNAKMTEMTVKKPSYDPVEDALDLADLETLESDGLLSDDMDDEPIVKPPTAKREKMPAITMQWRKPALPRDRPTIRRVLALDNTQRLNPKRFENMWEEYVQRHNASFRAAHRPASSAFLASMEAVGIVCMASGTVNGVEKYVLYAKQKDTTDYFFVSIDILVATNETNLSIRTGTDTNESLIQQFVALVDAQLDKLMK